MLEGYIDFVKSLFPCISPYEQEYAKECIRQFYSRHSEFPCFTTEQIPELNQGDIITNIPFRHYNELGEEEERVTNGIIISSSCDIENDIQVLLAPFLPIEELGLDDYNIRNNLYFSLLYFPDFRYSSMVADLSLMSPFPKQPLVEQIEKGLIQKEYSLNLIGYYLLISKLTVHLLRPEDLATQSLRDSDCS